MKLVAPPSMNPPVWSTLKALELINCVCDESFISTPVVVRLWPSIVKPPISPLVAVILPLKSTLLAVTLPEWSTLKALELIKIVCDELLNSIPDVLILWSSISKPPIDADTVVKRPSADNDELGVAAADGVDILSALIAPWTVNVSSENCRN